MNTMLKLGTRKSLLALTQSQWVAHQIMEKNPGVTVELVGIETKGDQITDIPLSKIEGKEFFIKELDEALLEKKIDFTVHSLKDLSLIRPENIFSASIPKRALSNDLLIIHNESLKKITQNQSIKIGTSAPRRLENTPKFLNSVFYSQIDNPQNHYEFIEIRGNVNTRISRIHLNQKNERFLDGVILAAAGLNRLKEDPKANIELQKLLENTSLILLPLSLSPPAPGQGALAIECRSDDLKVKEIILSIHHKETAHEVGKERATLKEYGGGCHQKFGASLIHYQKLGPIFIVKGKDTKNNIIDRYEFETPKIQLKNGMKIFDGTQWKSKTLELLTPVDEIKKYSHLFIAHHRAVHEAIMPLLQHKTLWTSGVKSWAKLHQMGLHIQGCLENLGLQKLNEYTQSQILALPQLSSWGVLTHANTNSSLGQGNIIPTYVSKYSATKEIINEAKTAELFFWQSPEQFDSLESHLNKNTYHFCGSGKTLNYLQGKNLSFLCPFPHSLLWKKWLKENGV